MFGKTVSAIMLSLLVMSTLALAFKIQIVKADFGIIYINGDGSISPSAAPIYTADNITYTLTGNITADEIVVERDRIVLDGAGFTVQGPGTGHGTDLSNRNNITIENTNIENFGFGAYLENSSNNTISGNNITNNSRGVWLGSSSDNSISGNNITANNLIGIWLYSSSSNSISGNNITNNVDGIYLDSSSNGNSISGNNIIANSENGIYLDSSSNGNSISGNTFTNDGLSVWNFYQKSVENNTVNGRPLVYLEDMLSHTVDDAGQVILIRCKNIKVEGLNLTRTDFGIKLSETSDSIISGNNITASGLGGILLSSSSNNSISGNNMTANNHEGIWLDSSSNGNSISGNNITANKYEGILLSSSSSNSISGNNTIANNGGGILLSSSSNYNSIYENKITENNWLGLYLSHSSNNTVSGNNITNNNHGIYLEESSDNRIYHNNFRNNTKQVYDVSWDYPQYYSPSINVWDGYHSGGNYWSDYNGTDSYGDGIGDVPYIIDTNNLDNYPLMSPWTHTVGDVNFDGKVGLDDLVLLANAYNSKVGDANWNPLADMAPPYGIIGLTDLVTMAIHYGQHDP